jgi:predicted GIY-YIG superfamily endonuclease
MTLIVRKIVYVIIKGGSRAKKIDLINKMNPEFKDLYDNL